MKRGQEIRVSRIPHASGYVWEGYWETVPDSRYKNAGGGDCFCPNCRAEVTMVWDGDAGCYICPSCKEEGVLAHPVGRVRKVYSGGGIYSADAIWLDIGGYLLI